MTRSIVLALAAVVAGLCLGGCASSGAGEGALKVTAGAAKSWRKITQVEQRFAVFIDEPAAARQGDLLTFRLVYIYAPGEVRFNDQVVGWQEYAAMTVNCVAQEMKPGPRVRYSPDGKVMLSDDDEEFAPINADTAAAEAARVRCAPDAGLDAERLANSRTWMDLARQRLAGAPENVLAH